MSEDFQRSRSQTQAVGLFEPRPDTLFSLDATARMTGLSRHTLLVYCNSGMIKPVRCPPDDCFFFTDETIFHLRRIEYLREFHGINLKGIKMILDLAEEVERLHHEIHFLREHR